MLEAKRTLVKSAPELWAEVSDPGVPGPAPRRLRGDPASPAREQDALVAWEGEHGTGSVRARAVRLRHARSPWAPRPGRPRRSRSPNPSRCRSPGSGRGCSAGAPSRRPRPSRSPPGAGDPGRDGARRAHRHAGRAGPGAPPPVLARLTRRVRFGAPCARRARRPTKRSSPQLEELREAAVHSSPEAEEKQHAKRQADRARARREAARPRLVPGAGHVRPPPHARVRDGEEPAVGRRRGHRRTARSTAAACASSARTSRSSAARSAR